MGGGTILRLSSFLSPSSFFMFSSFLRLPSFWGRKPLSRPKRPFWCPLADTLEFAGGVVLQKQLQCLALNSFCYHIRHIKIHKHQQTVRVRRHWNYDCKIIDLSSTSQLLSPKLLASKYLRINCWGWPILFLIDYYK